MGAFVPLRKVEGSWPAGAAVFASAENWGRIVEPREELEPKMSDRPSGVPTFKLSTVRLIVNPIA